MRYNARMERNVAARLQESIPSDEWDLLSRIADTALELDLPLYVVGGLPRDLLLGHPSNDFDLVVEGNATALADRLATRYGGKVTAHSRFGTAKWDLRGSQFEIREQEWKRQSLDLISARSETYKHPAALPTVKLGSIEDDLRRRDFSINALAIRLDGSYRGELLDDLGGMEDLQAGIVRVLHDGSFTDDPTRMYRAVRYEQRYRFRIAADTLALLPGGRELVAKLSPQRIRHELELILNENRAAAMLSRLAELDLLKPIHPDLFFDEAAQRRLSHASERPAHGLRWLLWLMILSGDQIRSLNRRLHFHADIYSALVAASQLWADLPSLSDLSPSQWVERLDAVPLSGVTAVALGSGSGPAKVALERYLATWRHIKPRTTGHDLKRLGVEPGPAYRTILQDLRRAWLDGRIHSEQEEKDYLMELVSRQANTETGKQVNK
jgi:tRNA nucleotidyltransferase (CCA-adding enzyme)